MSDPRVALLRDMIAGIQAQCALALGLIGQMSGGGAPVPQTETRASGPSRVQHYGEAAPSAPSRLAERVHQIAGAQEPPNAPAGASTPHEE